MRVSCVLIYLKRRITQGEPYTHTIVLLVLLPAKLILHHLPVTALVGCTEQLLSAEVCVGQHLICHVVSQIIANQLQAALQLLPRKLAVAVRVQNRKGLTEGGGGVRRVLCGLDNLNEVVPVDRVMLWIRQRWVRVQGGSRQTPLSTDQCTRGMQQVQGIIKCVQLTFPPACAL